MGVPFLYTCLAPRSAVRTSLQKKSQARTFLSETYLSVGAKREIPLFYCLAPPPNSSQNAPPVKAKPAFTDGSFSV